MLCSERTTFPENEDVIEQGIARFRGDRYKFHTVSLDTNTPSAELFEAF